MESFLVKLFAWLLIFVASAQISAGQEITDPRLSPMTNAPVTTASTIGGAVPGTVEVAIIVTGFNNIGAISLSLDYDYSVLHFTGGTPNPLLPSFPAGEIDLSTGYRRITMGWFGSGVTLSDGSTIMTLSFTYLSGITSLTWFDNGPSCEYADADFNVLNDLPTGDFYINGYVCGAIGVPGSITGQEMVCAGQTGEMYSIELLDNATSYNWAAPAGATIVTGQGTNAITLDFSVDAMSGSLAVYGINPCGNGSTAALPLTVNELPVANAGNDTTINYGTSIILHAEPGGPGTYSYHWSPEALLVDPDVRDPQTVMLTSTTLFTVMVTNTVTMCQQTDQVIVTIAGGPLSVNPIAVPSSICLGGSAQLFTNAGGGSGNYTYLWTSDPPGSPPWSSDVANPVVVPDSSKNYSVTVFDGFTTEIGSVSLMVLPLPTATISGGDTLCGTNVFTSLQVDLTGTPPWNFTYSYGSTSVFISNLETSPYNIIASDPGDYIITAIEDAHCNGLAFGLALVRKYPIPAKPEITLYEAELISSSCCGNQWYLNDVPIPGATGQTCQVMGPGLYHVVVTINSCRSEPSETVEIVGLNENNAGRFSVFPNPAKNYILIKVPTQNNGKHKVTVFSSTGSTARELIIDNLETLSTLDISKLQPGLYFIRIVGENFNFATKLIKN